MRCWAFSPTSTSRSSSGSTLAVTSLALTPTPIRRLARVPIRGVRDIAAAAARLIALGAVAVEAVEDVGEGIKLGTFRSPAGDLVGLIENPVFKL